MSKIGRWYAAIGGTGLEVKVNGYWCVAGYILQRGKRWNICVNPHQDEGYRLAAHDSLEAAKADFLNRMGVTAIEEDHA